MGQCCSAYRTLKKLSGELFFNICKLYVNKSDLRKYLACGKNTVRVVIGILDLHFEANV